jgi:hypothetical protein
MGAEGVTVVSAKDEGGGVEDSRVELVVARMLDEMVGVGACG